MSRYNRDIKILVTVIEGTKTDSFLIAKADIPWDFHIGEIKNILEECLGSNVDYEDLMNDYRERKAKRRASSGITCEEFRDLLEGAGE